MSGAEEASASDDAPQAPTPAPPPEASASLEEQQERADGGQLSLDGVVPSEASAAIEAASPVASLPTSRLDFSTTAAPAAERSPRASNSAVGSTVPSRSRSLPKKAATTKDLGTRTPLDMWDAHGNLKIGAALSGAAERSLSGSERGPGGDLLSGHYNKPLNITRDQYRLMYLVARLQNVAVDGTVRSSLEADRRSRRGVSKSRTMPAGVSMKVNDAEPEAWTSKAPNASWSVGKSGAANKVAPVPAMKDAPEVARADGNEIRGTDEGHETGAAKTTEASKKFQQATDTVIGRLKMDWEFTRHFDNARSVDDKMSEYSSRWVHRTPLLVYIYEGILLQVFDYDFSPGNENAGKSVVNMNISTEGVDDLSDLQAMGLILRLKLATKEHFTTTSYQVLPAGIAALQSMPTEDKLLVDHFLSEGVVLSSPDDLRLSLTVEGNRARDSARGVYRPFEVKYDEINGEFTLFDLNGNERISDITDFEDVSYVCSPYLPNCLRPTNSKCVREFSDFSQFAHLTTNGADTLREETKHVVLLSNLRILSSQYMVNGPNDVNALNEKLSLHATREELMSGQAGLVSAHVDHSPASATFDVAMSGMCAIFPMDYIRSTMANFESKVYLPEDPGVLQLENFGIHVHANGEVIFGVKVESVMSHVRDHLPVDLIARLVFDLHEDSASTLESISSAHQRLLMSSLFRGNNAVININPANNKLGRWVDIGKRQSLVKRQSLGKSASAPAGPRSSRKNSSMRLPIRSSTTNLSMKSMKSINSPGSFRRMGSLRRLQDDDSDDDEDLVCPTSPLSPTIERHVMSGQMPAMISSKYEFNMFTAFLCDSVEPRVPVQQLLDGEDAENDITQIVGRVSDAADLPCGGVVVSGEKGLIVSGEAGKKFEQLILVHASVMSRRIFVSTFFHRLYEMEADIDSIQDLISTHIGKPSGLAEIRRRVMEACKQASLLEALLTQAKATSADLPNISEATAGLGESDPAYAIMLKTLQTTEFRDELITRLKDLENLLHAARLGLNSLRENTDVISEVQMFKLQESLQSNTRNLESLFRSNESASSSLEIMQLVIGGSLGFTFLDRVTGEWSVMDTEWGRAFFDRFIDPPGVWFLVSLVCFILIVAGLHFTMRAMLKKASADMCMRYSLHIGIDILAMRRMLKNYTLYSEEADTDIEGNNMYKVSWEEPGANYGGTPLQVEISVDQGHARLCTLNLKYNRRDSKLSVPEVQDKFFSGLVAAGVINDIEELGELVRKTSSQSELERLDSDMRKSSQRRLNMAKQAAKRNMVKIVERVPVVPRATTTLAHSNSR